jgi:NCS2 family nucleobase:cation symporter-2
MKKPHNQVELLYGFNDKPKFLMLLLFSIQYIVPNAISLLFIVLVLQQSSISNAEAISVISITMIIMAVINFLQSRRWKFTPGMLLPPSVAPPYIAPGILAIKAGALPLVFGMTIIAGLVEVALTFVIRHIRKIIPDEIAALILLLIAFELGLLGVHLYSQVHSPLTHTDESRNILFYIVSYMPLLLILVFDQLCNQFFKRFSIVLAALIGYVLIYACGYMDQEHLAIIRNASWFFVPHFFVGHYKFEMNLLFPFVIAAFICSVKMIGSIFALQEIQREEFTGRRDFKQLAKANFIDGLGTLSAGVFGSMGMNVSSSSIALSLSTGVTSRYISLPISILMFIFAFIPKIGYIFLYIPNAIMAAVLLDLSCSLVSSSCIILEKKMGHLKTQLYIGIGLTVGLSYGIYPQDFEQLPTYMSSFIGSSIALAMITAVFLYGFLRGISRLVRRS